MITDETGAIPYEKSNNVETSLFLTQGRITRKAFFLRFLLCVIIWMIFHLLFVFVFQPRYINLLKKPDMEIQEDTVQLETNNNVTEPEYQLISLRQEAKIKDLIDKGYKTYGPGISAKAQYDIFKVVDFCIVPIILLFFLSVQAVKRIHNTNHSGWFLIIPLYDVFLLFAKGSDGDNDYGLLPNAEKRSPSYDYSRDE